MTASIAMLAALTALAMAPRWFLYFDTAPKAAIVLAGAALLLFRFEKAEKGLAGLGDSRAGRWLIGAAIVDIVWTGFSVTISGDRALGFFGSDWRRMGALEHAALLLIALIGGAALRMEGERGLRLLLQIHAAATVLISGYAVAQYFGYDPFVDASLYRAGFSGWSWVRPPSTLGHATALGIYLALSIFLAAALWALESSRAGRIAAACAGGLATTALVLTGSRSGLIGVLAGGVFLLLRLPPTHRRRLGTACAAAVAAAALFYFTPLGQPLRDRTEAWWRTDALGGPRLLLWRDSARMAAAHPVAGVGPEMFAGRFPRYLSEDLARAYPDAEHESPHNIALDALLACGIPGLLFLILYLGLGVRAAVRSKWPPAVAAALGGGLIALAVGHQFVSFVLPTALLFYLTVAALVAGTPAVAPAPARSWRVWRMLAIPAGAVLLVAAIEIAWVDAKWGAVRNALGAGVLKYASIDARLLGEPGAELWYSRVSLDAARRTDSSELRNARWQDAWTAASRAAASAEDPVNARYQQALALVAAGDWRRAEQALQEAIELAPQWYKPHWLLAEVYASTARPEQARTQRVIARRFVPWEIVDK